MKWSDDDLRALRDVYRAGGFPAVRAAYPHVSKGILSNRVYAGSGCNVRSIKDLDREESTNDVIKRYVPGGNIDSAGLLLLFGEGRLVR